VKRSTKKLIASFRRERLNMTMTRKQRLAILLIARAAKGSKFIRQTHLL